MFINICILFCEFFTIADSQTVVLIDYNSWINDHVNIRGISADDDSPGIGPSNRSLIDRAGYYPIAVEHIKCSKSILNP